MQDIPYGYCHCGCGEQTNLAPATHSKRGWVKGQPVRYRPGHHGRKYFDPEFRDRYEIRNEGHETACWMWTAGGSDNGYGYLTQNGRTRPAHVVLYELHTGAVPPGRELDHRCRNRRCVNPAHLDPVTHAENVWRGLIPVLAPGQVREARRLFDGGMTRQELADRYGVEYDTMKQVISGRNWPAA